MRMVMVPPAGHLEGLRALVRNIQQSGRRPLIVSVTRPHATLQRSLAGDGAPNGIRYLDAITCLNGTPPLQPVPDVRYVRSPTMLEMIAMRTEQMACPETYVVVDSLNALSIYNGLVPVQEFAHFLANRLRQAGVDSDFLVADTQEGRRMAELLSDIMDETVEVAA